MNEMSVRLLKQGPPNSTIIVIGKTGCGKTTLIANLLLKAERFVILDVKEDYYPEYFGSETRVAFSINAFVDLLNAGTRKIIYSFKNSPNWEDTMESALRIIFEFQSRNSEHLPPLTIALDELNRFVGVNECSPALSDIVQRGRSLKINKVFGAQWFGTLPTWLRESFSEIYSFQHTDKAGLDRLEVYGFHPDDLSSLPPYVCEHMGKTGIERIKLIPISASSSKHNRESRD